MAGSGVISRRKKDVQLHRPFKGGRKTAVGDQPRLGMDQSGYQKEGKDDQSVHGLFDEVRERKYGKVGNNAKQG